jgi:hypothetical protein
LVEGEHPQKQRKGELLTKTVGRRKSELEMLHEDNAKVSAVGAGTNIPTTSAVTRSSTAFKDGEKVFAWWRDKWLEAIVNFQYTEDDGVLWFDVQEKKTSRESWQVIHEEIKVRAEKGKSSSSSSKSKSSGSSSNSGSDSGSSSGSSSGGSSGDRGSNGNGNHTPQTQPRHMSAIAAAKGQTYRELITAALHHHDGQACTAQITEFVQQYRSVKNLASRLSEYERRCWTRLADGCYKLNAESNHGQEEEVAGAAGQQPRARPPSGEQNEHKCVEMPFREYSSGKKRPQGYCGWDGCNRTKSGILDVCCTGCLNRNQNAQGFCCVEHWAHHHQLSLSDESVDGSAPTLTLGLTNSSKGKIGAVEVGKEEGDEDGMEGVVEVDAEEDGMEVESGNEVGKESNKSNTHLPLPPRDDWSDDDLLAQDVAEFKG